MVMNPEERKKAHALANKRWYQKNQGREQQNSRMRKLMLKMNTKPPKSPSGVRPRRKPKKAGISNRESREQANHCGQSSDEENMYSGFGNAEYLSSREPSMLSSPSPQSDSLHLQRTPCTPPNQTMPKSSRPPLATIYAASPMPLSTYRINGVFNPFASNTAHGTFNNLTSATSALIRLASIRNQVHQWCHGWGSPRHWPAQLSSGLHAAVQRNRVDGWVEELQWHSNAGRRMIESMHEVMDAEVPTEEWLYRDLWRQAVDLLCILHEGLACMDAHLSLIIPSPSLSDYSVS